MVNIVVVGGGQAGASTVAKLRALGFKGSLTLVCEENEYPYQRPPLSKQYLMGDFDKERLYLRPESYYRENDINVLIGQTCHDIDPGAGRIRVGKQSLPFDHLVLTTGSIPKNLPSGIGRDLDGVHTVRTLADTHAIRPEIGSGRQALVVGGGYIGLETASALSAKGMRVTVVEAAERILQRVAAPETSAYFRDLHQHKGVNLIEGTGLKSLDGDTRVRSATLSNDERLEVDLVVVGIGISPATGLAEKAGIIIDNGIKVNSKGQTSCTNIWASGDCTAFPRKNRLIRLESVQNAIDQSEVVAANILGDTVEYDPVPWFWSDQYDAKLQIAGLNQGYDSILTRQGPKDDAVSFWYMQGDTLLAVDAVNDSRSYMVGKRLLENNIKVEPEVLTNPKTDLKHLLRR